MAKVIILKQEKQFFIGKGIINIESMKNIVGEENDKFPKDFFLKFLRLLYRFQIVCRIDYKWILVPSKLPLERKSKSNKDLSSLDLLYRYQFFPYIPYGFWQLLICRLLFGLRKILNHDESDFQKNMQSSIPSCPYEDSGYKNTQNGFNYPVVNRKNILVNNDVVSNTDCHESASINDFEFESNYFTALTSQPKEVEEIEVNEIEFNVDIDEKEVNSNVLERKINQDYGNLPYDYVVEREESNYESISKNYKNVDHAALVSLPIGDIKNKNKIDTKSHCSQSSNDKGRLYIDKRNPTINDSGVESQEMNNFDYDLFARKKDRRNSSIADTAQDGKIPVEINEVNVKDSVLKRNKGSSKNEKLSFADSLVENLDETEPFSLTVGERDMNSVQSQEVGQTEDRQKELGNRRNIYFEKNNIPFAVDIPQLFKETLTCWQKGLIFDDGKLYFFIQEVIIKGKHGIVVKVTKNEQGSKVLCHIIDHVRTIVKEWYRELLPITQKAACPICITYDINSPYMFDVQQLFRSHFQRNGTTYIEACEKIHVPQIVALKVLCPEILLEDIPAKFRIKPDELHFIEKEHQKLGKSRTADVYRGKFKNSPSAIKVYKLEVSDLAAFDTFLDIRQEIMMLANLSGHKNIIEFLGCMLYPSLCTVTELAPLGSLGEVLHKKKIFLERLVVYQVVKELLSALQFIHSRNIIHRDIKTDNVVLFSTSFFDDVHAKLIDCGTANVMCPTGMKACVGTERYIAPEVYDAYLRDEYTEKIDVYSSGMVCYELLTRFRPFHNYQKIDVSTAVIKGERPSFKNVLRCMNGYYPMTEMMLRMWQDDSTQRPTAEQATELVSKPEFQLLYSKRVLEVLQNPLAMCYVKDECELWITCHGEKGSLILSFFLVRWPIC